MDKVFVFGFVIFAVVIIFSIFVEVDTIREERTEPEYISTPVSEIEENVFGLSGNELRSFRRSLRILLSKVVINPLHLLQRTMCLIPLIMMKTQL